MNASKHLCRFFFILWRCGMLFFVLFEPSRIEVLLLVRSKFMAMWFFSSLRVCIIENYLQEWKKGFVLFPFFVRVLNKYSMKKTAFYGDASILRNLKRYVLHVPSKVCEGIFFLLLTLCLVKIPIIHFFIFKYLSNLTMQPLQRIVWKNLRWCVRSFKPLMK